MKTIFDLKLPEGTTCTSLAILEPLCVVAAFNIPEIGIEIYALDPNTGVSSKIAYKPKKEKEIDQ